MVRSLRAHSLGFGATVSILSASLVIGFVGIGSEITPPPVESPDPRFFDWAAESRIAGQHIVTLAPESQTPGRLIDNDGTLEINPDHGDVDSTDAEEIRRAIDPGGYLTDEDLTLASLVANSKVSGVRSLGFDTYLVASTMSTEELAAVPGVQEAVQDVSIAGASADEYFGAQWPLENLGTSTQIESVADADVNGPRAWHRARGGGVVVAVVDSGVDVTHPDLAGAIWVNDDETCGNGVDDDANGYVDDCSGWDFADGTADVEDSIGHGTHVAGIIGARAGNGIGVAGLAYESTIMPLKIGDESPTLSAAVEAMAYAVDNGAQIINASWVTSDPAAAVVLERVIAAAGSAGVLVVAGAGNDGADLAAQPVYPASLDAPNLLTVGASTATDALASFSNTGGPVDLLAPGEHVVSTVPGGYSTFSGTSMAAPHVAAAAALLWSAEPNADVDDVVGALVDRAKPIAAGPRLDVGGAVEARVFSPSVGYTFVDFNSFEPGEAHPVQIRTHVYDPFTVPPQTPARFRFTMLAGVEGRPMAVTGLSIDTAGGTVETDATGRVFVTEELTRSKRSALVRGTEVLNLEIALPEGAYAGVIELVDMSDPQRPVTLGDPSAVFFTVGRVDPAIIRELPGLSQDSPSDADPVEAEPPAGEETDPGEQADPDDNPEDSGVGQDPAVGGGDSESPEPQAGEPGSDPGTESEPADEATEGDPSENSESPVDEDDPAPVDGMAVDGDGSPEVDAKDPVAESPEEERPVPTIALVRVNPDHGSVMGGTTVTVVGDIPSRPVISFGNAPARLVTVGDGFAVVETASHAAGPVDVEVVDVVTGERGVLPAAFTYIDETASNTGDNSDVDQVEPTEDAGEVAPTETPEEVSEIDDPNPGSVDDITDPSGGGTPAGLGNPEPGDPEPGDPEIDGPGSGDAGLPTGSDEPAGPTTLDLVPLPAGDPFSGLDLGGMTNCKERECPGWVLEPGVHHATDPRTGDHQNGSGKLKRDN